MLPRSAPRSTIPAKAPRPTGTVVALPLPASDEALVGALRAGRRDAKEALVDRFYEDVERILYRVLGPDSEIADLLQEVFIAALDSLHRLREPAALRAWLGSIAVHKARKLIRHRQRWAFIRSTPPNLLPETPAATPSAEVSEALRATYRILDLLPVDERIAFALRHVEGMELSATAEACGVSLATIKRRLKGAHERFMALAGDDSALANWMSPRSFSR